MEDKSNKGSARAPKIKLAEILSGMELKICNLVIAVSSYNLKLLDIWKLTNSSAPDDELKLDSLIKEGKVKYHFDDTELRKMPDQEFRFFKHQRVWLIKLNHK